MQAKFVSEISRKYCWRACHVTGDADVIRAESCIWLHRSGTFWQEVAALVSSATAIIGETGASDVGSFSWPNVTGACLPFFGTVLSAIA